jgi:hypothetical protein
MDIIDNKYKMVRDVSRSLQKSNAYIYGSFVYKTIIRDHYESLFNSKPEIKKIRPKYSSNMDEQLKIYNNSYYNLDLFPEYKDRMIEFDYINCYMHTSDFENLKKNLEKEGYSMDILRKNKNDINFLEETSAKSTLLTIIIKFKSNYLLKSILKNFNYQVCVNIIHNNDSINDIANEVFELSTFECNTLVLSPDNNYIIPSTIHELDEPYEKFIKINNIISDIKNKTTRIYYGNYNISKNMIKYILDQNINIYSDNFIVVDDYDNETCIICLDNFKETNKHIKDINCNTHYCFKCYNEMINRDDFQETCPVCGKDVLNDPIEDNIVTVMAELFD